MCFLSTCSWQIGFKFADQSNIRLGCASRPFGTLTQPLFLICVYYCFTHFPIFCIYKSQKCQKNVPKKFPKKLFCENKSRQKTFCFGNKCHGKKVFNKKSPTKYNFWTQNLEIPKILDFFGFVLEFSGFFDFSIF